MRISRRFKPVNMNGCVLYLPFYAYGGNAQGIWDMSGQGNHGTISGAVPGSYPMLAGQDLVTNGTFSGDTGWTKGTGWAITTVATKTAGVASDLEQDISAVAATKYFLTYTMTRTAGSLTPQIGGMNGTVRSASGTYTDEIAATGTGNLKFQADASFAGTVDNVSVQKIPGYESLGWYFDGSNASLNCGANASLNILDQISILMWERHAASTVSNNTLINKGSYSSSGYWFIFQNNVQVLFYSNQSGAAQGQISGALSLNVWECLAFTKNGTTGLHYRNGVDNTGVHVDLQNMASASANFYVGSYGGSANYLRASIGDILVFNRTLSAAEIKSYYELTRSRYGI